MSTQEIKSNDFCAVQKMTLKQELESVLNRNCLENKTDTPDFILAEYVASCLWVGENLILQREKWYGVKLRALKSAVEAAMNELGVPGPGYPAPVANAYEILKTALNRRDNDRPMMATRSPNC